MNKGKESRRYESREEEGGDSYGEDKFDEQTENARPAEPEAAPGPEEEEVKEHELDDAIFNMETSEDEEKKNEGAEGSDAELEEEDGRPKPNPLIDTVGDYSEYNYFNFFKGEEFA